jgi:hypothetical protein
VLGGDVPICRNAYPDIRFRWLDALRPVPFLRDVH